MKHLITLFATLALFASARAEVETYAIDPAHSSVGFTVRHVFTKVPGHFTKFSGTITVDRNNLERSSVEATIEVGSINTASEKRDGDLKTPDFFDAGKFPAITFKSVSWKKTGEGTFDVTGNLSIKNVTREVVLKVNLLGFGPGLMGAYVSGWEASTSLNRQDYAVTGPAWLGKAIGDDIAVSISIEADLKK